MYTRDLLPSFAGIPTFVRAPRVTLPQVNAGSVVVIGAAHDATSSGREGVRHGPKAIRDASVDLVYDIQASPSHTLVDIDTGKQLRFPTEGKIVDLGELPIYPLDLERTMSCLSDTVAEVLRRGAFPVVLGGDAFISYPLVQGAARGLGDGKSSLGYIQLSSQLNLGEGDDYLGENWHGATARRILESGVVKPRNMVFAGVAGYVAAQEWDLAEKHSMTVLPIGGLKDGGIAQFVRQAEEIAGKDCDSIYLSVDIGAVDTGYAPGRGEVVIGGMTPAELLEVMRALSTVDKICAIDFVEVAPTLDPSGRTERLAAEALIEFISPKAFV